MKRPRGAERRPSRTAIIDIVNESPGHRFVDFGNEFAFLQAAKERARRENKTVGEVLSELARAALTATPSDSRSPEPRAHYGFRPFARRGGIVTNELIDRLRKADAY